MLEQIFGSKTRVMLLRLFLNNSERFFFVRELTRSLNIQLNSVRRELANLERIGIIGSHTKEDLEKEAGKKLRDNKKYYKLKEDFVFADELRALIIKAHLILEKSLVKKVEGLGRVHLFLLSGVFVGRNDAPVDLLIVGQVNKPKVGRLVKGFEKELGQPINYTVMSKDDFLYRQSVADKFLYNLLDNKRSIILDRITANLKEPE